MKDRITTFINCQTKLKESIPIFIEVFKKYYGIEYEKEIEDKFNNAIFIGYQSSDALLRGLTKLEGELTNELITKIIEENNLSLTVKDLTNDYTLEQITLEPIGKFYEFYELFLQGKEEREKDFINKGFEIFIKAFPNTTFHEYQEIYKTKKVPENSKPIQNWLVGSINYYLDSNNIDKELNDKLNNAIPFLEKLSNEEIKDIDKFLKDNKTLLDNLYSSYKDIKTEYEKEKDNYKEYYLEKKHLEELKPVIDNEIYKAYLKRSMNIFNEEQQHNIESFLNGDIKYYEIDEYVKSVLNNTVFLPSLLEYFGQTAEEILNDENASTWRREEIKLKRIEYFKMNQIDLKDNYEEYLKSSEVNDKWPDINRIERFISEKEKLKSLYYQLYYQESISYKSIREIMDNNNIIDNDEVVDANLFLLHPTFVNASLRKTNDGYESLPTVFINFDDYATDCLDHHIVHELNHLFELSILNIKEDTYSGLCGWDTLDGVISNKKDEQDSFNEREKRPYELLNEIINELIAQEISALMHEKGIYIFDDSNNSKYQYTTGYDFSKFLVADFFEEFKDRIIASRRNGNINIIMEEVGKDNLEELNNLFKIYNEKLSGFRYYQLLESKKNNEKTELTKIYDELVNKRDEILSKMRLYSMMKESNINQETSIKK